MNSKFVGYRCSLCGEQYSPADVTYTCPKDRGNLDVVLDYDAIKSKYKPEDILSRNDPSLWRYLPLLPVNEPEGAATPLHVVGGTPIYKLTRLAEPLALQNLWLKDESRNPTASFKDRASAVVVARAREIKAEVVVTASTGNAGAALAGMSAAVGQKAIIFAPKSAPQAKVAQLLVFGAKVILVDGTYDDAFDLTVRAADEFGWYCRNTGYNPYTLEGKKTASFEIGAQLRWRVPDKVFVGVGDGNILSGLWKGFGDLHRLGWIERLPRLVGVQAAGASAIVDAANGNGVVRIGPAHTIADSISVGQPRDATAAIRAIRDSGGCGVKVSDDEIIAAIGRLARATGVFAEPAAAAAFAGFVKQCDSGAIKLDECVLLMLTGNGLKDVDAARRASSEPLRIKPEISESVFWELEKLLA